LHGFFSLIAYIQFIHQEFLLSEDELFITLY
jgi:hypothetical protein